MTDHLDEHALAQVCRSAGLADRNVMVHSAFRSFGGQLAGPDVVLDVLLGIGATVMTPTFTYEFDVPDGAPPGPVFDPARNALTVRDMGAIPAALLARAGRRRGRHPVDSFSAIGPYAETLIRGQQPNLVYAPLEALCASGGAVVMMGVGLTSMTLLHLAEAHAGRSLLEAHYHAGNGRIDTCRVGGCSNGFDAFDAVLAPIESRVQAGPSTWRIFSAAAALVLARDAIRANPDMTHCGRRCPRCDAALGR